MTLDLLHSKGRPAVTASRLPRLVRISGFAVAAALALTSCGTDLNPGKAATVGDESISGGTVDDLVEAACEYTEAIRKSRAPAPSRHRPSPTSAPVSPGN